MRRTKRNRYGPWRVSPEDYHALKERYHDLKKKFSIWGKSGARDHLELLESYNRLRYNGVVQFLMFFHIIPREKG